MSDADIPTRLSTFTKSPRQESTAYCIAEAFVDDPELTTFTTSPDEPVIGDDRIVMWVPADVSEAEGITFDEYFTETTCKAGYPGGDESKWRVYAVEPIEKSTCSNGETPPQYPLDADVVEEVADAIGVAVYRLAEHAQIIFDPDAEEAPDTSGDSTPLPVTTDSPVVFDLSEIPDHSGRIVVAPVLMDYHETFGGAMAGQTPNQPAAHRQEADKC